MTLTAHRALLFDWGDTVMRNYPDFAGPMFSWPHVEVIPHVRETLALLYPTWILAIATNAADSSEEDIHKALQRVALDVLFDRIYCFHNIGHKKPSPQFFAAITKDVGLDPAQMIMVGDQFEADIQGAVQAGMRGIWFNEKTGEEKTSSQYRTIHDFQALPEALAAL